eukprot:scaffold1590_cov417-Prasinococcus_capsulatus_cf.AAC.8
MAHQYDDGVDPWAQVEDLDGTMHYSVLEITSTATPEEVKKAYRVQARKHHPDKGGDPEHFARVQKAFSVLSDPAQRDVYDTWAKNMEFRYVKGIAPRTEGGEDIILDEFDRLHPDGVDAATQLVLTCEVCMRPANKVCWVCKMNICDFCTVKRHWKGSFPLHWPCIESKGSRRQLALQELEKKRLQDARETMQKDKNFRNEFQMADMREFKRLSKEAADDRASPYKYNIQRAKYYMWAQTPDKVYIALHVPVGYEDKELDLKVSEDRMVLLMEGAPPVLDRAFDYQIDAQQPVGSLKTKDNRLFLAWFSKAKRGLKWMRLFKGDPDGVRELQPLYRMTENDDDVIVEIDCPFWIEKDDCTVVITADGISVKVRGYCDFHRTYFKDSDPASKHVPVDVQECLWSLDGGEDEDGEAIKVLALTLVKPPLSNDEIVWRKGKRADNRAKKRPDDGFDAEGVRFFANDEDHFDLEDPLIALCFRDEGKAFVPFSYKNKDRRRSGWARDRFGLTAGAQEWLDRFEASAFRMSDGQSLEDWQERGPEKQETRQPEGVYSGYGKKIDKLSTELDEMTARMEALLGKAGP